MAPVGLLRKAPLHASLQLTGAIITVSSIAQRLRNKQNNPSVKAQVIFQSDIIEMLEFPSTFSIRRNIINKFAHYFRAVISPRMALRT